jgi:hypothetical protein
LFCIINTSVSVWLYYCYNEISQEEEDLKGDIDDDHNRNNKVGNYPNSYKIIS